MSLLACEFAAHHCHRPTAEDRPIAGDANPHAAASGGRQVADHLVPTPARGRDDLNGQGCAERLRFRSPGEASKQAPAGLPAYRQFVQASTWSNGMDITSSAGWDWFGRD
jgi:hypothetical protein